MIRVCHIILVYMQVNKTRVTWAQREAPGPGRYYCTVVAYNHALDPSRPVCTDGVTIDITPPVLNDVSVGRLKTKPGLIKNNVSSVYLVDRNRNAVLLQEPPTSCL